MEPKIAQKIGRKFLFRGTILVLVVLELLWLYRETQGDFENGVLFFIEYHRSPQVLGLLILIIALPLVFGGLAGKEILILERKFLWVGIKYAMLANLVIVIYLCAIAIFVLDHSFAEFWRKMSLTFEMEITLPLLIIWIACAYIIKLKKVKR